MHEQFRHDMDASSIVCFGAGNLGRRVARAVRPVLFCDNNTSLWHTSVDGVPVDSPNAAIERYPDAIFIVAIWHPSRIDTMAGRIHQLKSLGAKQVIPFWRLFSQHRDLLPNLFWELSDYYTSRRDEIEHGRALLDSEGQAEFDRQMRLRQGELVDQRIAPGPQYFPDKLFELSAKEVFVDGGAYDGDTIEDFRRATNNQFDRIIAFEPDPANFEALRSGATGDPRIEVHRYAVGERRETVRFAIDGTGSHVSAGGSCEVEVVSLDEMLEGIGPTYIKLDIEGSEPNALKGAQKTLTAHRPKMAVCAYHAPDHLWRIPQILNKMLPNSLLTLRAHCADGFDCVCYCIPR